MTNNQPLRALPAVNHLLKSATGQALTREYGHTLTVDALRAALQSAREQFQQGAPLPTPEALLHSAERQLMAQSQPSLRPVINATGVILHTNLGRAPLSAAAIRAVEAVARQYSTLEFDLLTGERGSRNTHPEALLCKLTGAQAALVVNNAASALVLTLAALTQGQAVIMSRGQAVEIGGGFRIPEIMRQSGATLVEVGTTNKTRAADYIDAIQPNTAALLRVHASNFKQVGFVESVEIATLAEIAAAHHVYLIDDVGSGALLDTTPYGLDAEPLVQASVAAGADVVIFSGDKLLGGPQAGVIVGKQAAIAQLKRHPLARALRADKLTLAALLATLQHYQRDEALTQVPVWWMISRKLCDLGRLAKSWSKQFPHASIQKGVSTVGGGSLPGNTLPTVLLALDVPHPSAFAAALRALPTPIITRVQAGRVLIDPRTVFPEQETAMLKGIATTFENNDFYHPMEPNP